jgi:hypothetical protein
MTLLASADSLSKCSPEDTGDVTMSRKEAQVVVSGMGVPAPGLAPGACLLAWSLARAADRGCRWFGARPFPTPAGQ